MGLHLAYIGRWYHNGNAVKRWVIRGSPKAIKNKVTWKTGQQ